MNAIGPRRARYLALLQVFTLAGIALGASPLLGARHPLHKALETFAAKGTDYSATTDPRTGNIVIRYLDGSKWQRVVWVWPHQLEVTVAAEVHEVPGGALRYSYRMLNSPSSRQRADHLGIGFGGSIVNVSSPRSWLALTFGFVPLLGWSDIRGKIPGLPPGASLGGFSFEAATHVATRRLATDRYRPGAGFVRTPGALPGIVACYVSGFTRLADWPSEGPDVNLPDVLSQGLTGSTVGPLEIPEQDTVDKILTAMDRAAREGLELGWIEKHATAKQYQAMLAAVRQSLFKAPGGEASPRDRDDAVSSLRKLATQVQADARAGAISSEEVALLTYNTRYLLERLGAGTAR